MAAVSFTERTVKSELPRPLSRYYVQVQVLVVARLVIIVTVARVSEKKLQLGWRNERWLKSLCVFSRPP